MPPPRILLAQYSVPYPLNRTDNARSHPHSDMVDNHSLQTNLQTQLYEGCGVRSEPRRELRLDSPTNLKENRLRICVRVAGVAVLNVSMTSKGVLQRTNLSLNLPLVAGQTFEDSESKRPNVALVAVFAGSNHL